MKAVAWGDRLGGGAREEALKYATDLLRLLDAMPAELEWGWVRELLGAYPVARTRLAAQIINDTLKTEFQRQFEDE
jgi:hypothetical protein